jgi:hypothetical protein
MEMVMIMIPIRQKKMDYHQDLIPMMSMMITQTIGIILKMIVMVVLVKMDLIMIQIVAMVLIAVLVV